MSQATAASGDQVFRFLDLPAELRRAVYKHLFRRPYIEIVIKPRTDNAMSTLSQLPKPKACLEHYPWDITLACRDIRAESLGLLDAKAFLLLRADNLGDDLDLCSVQIYFSEVQPQALCRVENVTFVVTRLWLWEPGLASLLEFLPRTKRLDFALAPYSGCHTTRKGCLDAICGAQPLHRQEVKPVVCHETLKGLVEKIVLHAGGYDYLSELDIHTSIIAPVTNEKEPRNQMYGLVQIDSAKYTSRNIGWDELCKPGFEAFDRPVKDQRERT